jgi:hypothetical protein
VIFGQEGGLEQLLTAPFSFVNDRLAALYGVPAPGASAPGGFGKVNLDPARRGGLYTQLGFLARNANDDQTQPIMRGVHLNRHVLCVTVPPPPPNVDTKAPPVTAAMTTREHFAQLTAAPQCQGCHGLINPLGYAFENYDNLGRFRTSEGNLPVDSEASYPFREGTKTFKNAIELNRIIAGSEQANECYARNLFAYFYAREPVAESAGDKALLAEVAKRSRQGASVKSMILDLVATDAFIYRLP